MMKVLAIIPARGGSKGIPLKNMTSVNGKPLIDWTIQAAQQSKYVTKIVVSSDSEEILKHVNSLQGVMSVERPSELAKDTTPTEPVIQHVLEQVEGDYDVLLLLQPTSPLRRASDIDNAYEKFIKSKATALISVVTPKFHPLKSFKIGGEGFLEGVVNNDYPFMPRQELPKTFYPNGAIYMICKENFTENQKLITHETIPYEMNQDNSIDIDTEEDIKRVEKKFKN